MPWGLVRFQQSHCLHFITFTCYRRQPFLNTNHAKNVFERSLEQTRRSYRFDVIGYVVMPEHVHLLVSEPERATLSRAIQSLKQSASQKLNGHHGHFWQARYYDFNVFTPAKRVEKLKYIHRNPGVPDEHRFCARWGGSQSIADSSSNPRTGPGAATATTRSAKLAPSKSNPPLRRGNGGKSANRTSCCCRNERLVDSQITPRRDPRPFPPSGQAVNHRM
jgi:putative transposase